MGQGLPCCTCGGGSIESSQDHGASTQEYTTHYADESGFPVKMSEAQAVSASKAATDNALASECAKPEGQQEDEPQQPPPPGQSEDVIVQENADPDIANLELGNLLLDDTPARLRETPQKLSHELLAGFNSQPAWKR
mmetsp:Transcript_13680/g.30974  ORF Transcript_13680/g.30974 Transcript_13680/m.30974 type:complete len:137 (-) Transcript_13680:177-587(-)